MTWEWLLFSFQMQLHNANEPWGSRLVPQVTGRVIVAEKLLPGAVGKRMVTSGAQLWLVREPQDEPGWTVLGCGSVCRVHGQVLL